MVGPSRVVVVAVDGEDREAHVDVCGLGAEVGRAGVVESFSSFFVFFLTEAFFQSFLFCFRGYRREKAHRGKAPKKH